MLKKIIFYGVLALILFVTLFPLYWVVSTSMKTLRDAFAMPPVWLFSPTLENYGKVLNNPAFIKGFANSMIISITASVLAIAIAAFAAYGIVQQGIERRRSLEGFILSLRIAPAILFVIPTYYLSMRMGFLNSHGLLIAVYAFINIPFAISLLVTFFEEVPKEMREAGLMDGASELRVFWHIVLPVVRGGLVATLILCVLFTWNEFFIALVLSGRDTQTLPVTITSFLTFQGIEWGALTAAATLIMLPMLILGLLVQGTVVRGMAAGSVKG
jgi:ABC-type glycerol-3-phosphate transport system permease component